MQVREQGSGVSEKLFRGRVVYFLGNAPAEHFTALRFFGEQGKQACRDRRDRGELHSLVGIAKNQQMGCLRLAGR